MKNYWKENKLDKKKYYEAQIKLNKKKFNAVWVSEKDITAICDFFQYKMPFVGDGICHGSRNGFEVRRFKQYLENCNVIGTDISPTANEVPSMIQHDFHEVKNDWLHKFDFIYSNAIDHSYDPAFALDVWMSCLKDTGICALHLSLTSEIGHGNTPGDCFGATNKEYKQMIEKKYKIIGQQQNNKTNSIIFYIQDKNR